MSLSLSLTKTIDETINTFITRVSSEYKLDKDELRCLWDGDKKSVSVCVSSVKEDLSNNTDSETLLKCNKQELNAMCKKRGLKCSGTKSELLSRLLGKEVVVDKKVTKKTVNKSKVETTDVVKKLTAKIPNIVIRRNQFNNYEHPDSKLIFDNETKYVIGKQNDDGSVDDLTEDDIDLCNAFKFKFKLPDNLDSKVSLDDVIVDELEEEEEDLDEIEEEDLGIIDDCDDDDDDFDDDLDYYSEDE